MVAKQIQIKDHVLFLKHVKLDDKAAKGVLKKYNIDVMQLPRILKKDPAIKGGDFEVGDIIEFERKSVTANRTKFYRVVVSG